METLVACPYLKVAPLGSRPPIERTGMSFEFGRLFRLFPADLTAACPRISTHRGRSGRFCRSERRLVALTGRWPIRPLRPKCMNRLLIASDVVAALRLGASNAANQSVRVFGAAEAMVSQRLDYATIADPTVSAFVYHPRQLAP